MSNLDKDKVFKLKLAEIDASAEKFDIVFSFLKHIVSVIGFIAAIYFIFSGLRPIFEANPSSISAMAGFVEKFNVSNICGYKLSAFLGTGWAIERTGKKRITSKKAELQNEVEKNDTYRSSSGLTKSGNTPAAITVTGKKRRT